MSFSGCGKGNSGAKLSVTTDTPLSAPASKPVLSKAVGDGDSDTFPDSFLTPSAFTIGLKSFKFFKQNNTTTPGQVQQSTSIFDTTFDSPKVIDFKTGAPQQVAETVNDPSEGTYDRVEYEISYMEMILPLCRADNTCEDRRLRFYLKDFTDPTLNNFSTPPLDLLISQAKDGFDFGWVSAAQGLPTLFPITGQKPADPVKVGVNQFSSGTPSPVFSVAISPPLVVPTKPKGKYLFTLNFDLSDLFFFDNTDAATIDPAAPFHFNALADPSISRDGKVRFICAPAPATCLTPDFSPGLPVVTLTVTQEAQQ